MARHWQGTGKQKMRKSRQVMLHFADVARADIVIVMALVLLAKTMVVPVV